MAKRKKPKGNTKKSLESKPHHQLTTKAERRRLFLEDIFRVESTKLDEEGDVGGSQ